MKERGWLGVKSDVGFYRYRRGRALENDDAMALLRADGRGSSRPRRRKT